MKKIINYEKDILFKTKIGEICSISLEHDFTIDSGLLRGDFIVSGEYKASELSVNKEPFTYKLPIEYELEPNVNIETLNYEIENFEYNVNDDELSIYIDFGVRYDEKIVEPIIPEVSTEMLNSEPVEVFNDDIVDLPKFNAERLTKDEEEIIQKEEPRMISDEKMNILDNSIKDDENYVIYHVHIVREGDTLEKIADKYSSSVELIKAYNNTEIIQIKSKLIVPENVNE